ncbi:LysR family transcriptional regulator [Ramlibacter sp. USB13]|uniref:LysR family transcriptional regulator n=1 Tax=Ramlibacter cellulosilyticus TaxID=2764187 RepID=A0A923MQB5_9BURK|nr:LysR family transcriptional regulator [Ramlibacter cellulosilyticus]MBC5783857.1 LysR family transcriptional regulator [Ramlibacter cellulosilyticus]
MLDLFQLRCFVAVAEELHFGRAAARLHMTQPPLSRQIQLLEHAVKVRLLERTSRSVRLTAAGEVLYRDAAAILRLAQDAAAAAERTGKGLAGRVVVGYTAVAGYALMPALLAAANQALPDIEIVLEEMVSSEQLHALEAGTIDIGFVRPQHASGPLRYHLAAREPMLLALPAAHPLAARERIRMQDLAGEPLIMYSQKEGRYFHDRITALFMAAAGQPQYVHHIGQTHTIMALVRAGIGLAIVPASAAQLRLENVVYKPLWRRDVVAEIYLAWRAAERNPALQPLREFFIRQLATPAAPKPRRAAPAAAAPARRPR